MLGVSLVGTNHWNRGLAPVKVSVTDEGENPKPQNPRLHTLTAPFCISLSIVYVSRRVCVLSTLASLTLANSPAGKALLGKEFEEVDMYFR
jgi:hypothetical protein